MWAEEVGGCKDIEMWQLPSVSSEGVDSLCSVERSLTTLLICILLVLAADTTHLTYRSVVILLGRDP